MNSAFIKFVLILVAVGIIVSYVQPAWKDIDRVQNDLDEVNTAIANATRNNGELRRLQGLEQSLSQQEKIDLDIFLPREIDPLQVMADVTTIGALSRATIVSISAAELIDADPDVVTQSGAVGSELAMQDFTVEIEGSYEAFKTFLRNIERNKYLLEVVSVAFSGNESNDETSSETAEGGVATPVGDYSVTLRTYAFPVVSGVVTETN